MRNTLHRIIIIAVIGGLFFLFYFFDLNRHLTLESLKESREYLFSLYETNTFMFIFLYSLFYITATALAIPGAVIMTLAGGAVFGLVTGTIIISFASTIGATLACIVSRFLLRDWVQDKFRDKLKLVNNGIEREGAFYLFTLRLIPLFPFFMINLVMGLTRMKIRRYYWVSQAGMLPGTIVFVNAGSQLGKLETVSGIFSPGMIVSFALLGLFPLIARKLVGLYRKKNPAIIQQNGTKKEPVRLKE